MKKYIRLFMIAIVTLNLWGCASNEAQKDLKIERAKMITVTATVESVDMVTRMVTLRGADGKKSTIYAGKEVVNLPQVRVGDEVVAIYSEAVAVRMAKPGEVRDETAQGMVRAVPGSKPGALEVYETTVTAEIVDIDKTLETATLRLPDGNIRIVKVQDPANLEKVKIGDTIVITYSNELAISVQKTK